MNDNIRLSHGQRVLLLIWFVGATIPLVILFQQTMVGNAFMTPEGKDLSDRVWEWFLPTVVPTLSLVIGVVANNELREEARRATSKRRVSTFFFRVTCALSIMYLAIVAVMPIATVTRPNAEWKVTLLLKSHMFLPALQGLVSVALAVFFIATEDAGAAASTDAEAAPRKKAQRRAASGE